MHIDTDAEIFRTESGFEALGLRKEILTAIGKLGFVHPTHIQSELVPLGVAGRDVLGQSRTGTGKTAAFGLPLLHRLAENPSPFSGLVLCPTRELAIQIAKDLQALAGDLPVKIMPVYGGQRMKVQSDKLKKGPHILVGTPGRVMDFHQRGELPYDNIQMAVLDEVDRMLDIGFRDDIRRILGGMTQKHQTIFVSATISEEIERLARKYLTDPERLTHEGKSLTVARVDQQAWEVNPWDKSRLLAHLIKKHEPEVTIVFCRTKMAVDRTSKHLASRGIKSEVMHGDIRQSRRNRVLEEFKTGKVKLLIASDLAARGIDVDGITHVVNYDIPDNPDDYVHRIGRTARAGQEGTAWTFICPDEGHLLMQVEQLTNVHIPSSKPDDFEPGPIPESVLRRREEEAQRLKDAEKNKRTRGLELPDESKAADSNAFPGGVVPKSMPGRRMGGRIRTRRR